MVYLICAVIGLGGRGEIIHGLKRLPKAPLHADVRSYLSGSSVIQPLAAREEIGTVVFIYLFIENQNNGSYAKNSYIAESGVSSR